MKCRRKSTPKYFFNKCCGDFLSRINWSAKNKVPGERKICHSCNSVLNVNLEQSSECERKEVHTINLDKSNNSDKEKSLVRNYTSLINQKQDTTSEDVGKTSEETVLD